MTRHVALLRAVNVGGRQRLTTSDLAGAAATAGFGEVATILQAGTLVFTAVGDGAALERRLAAALTDRAALATDVMVRSADEWRALIADNPFADLARDDPAHLVLLVLNGEAKPGAEPAVRRAIQGREAISVGPRDAYIAYRDGIGRSKLTNAVLERYLGVSGTGRNWNTVLKVAARLGL